MATKAQEIQDRLVGLEHEVEVLSGRVEDYSRELQAQRDRWVDVPVHEAARDVMSNADRQPLPTPWRDASHPDHPDYIDPREKGRREALARAKEPVIVDTSNEPVKPAGWDVPDDGNPYNPAVIAQRQEDHEREARENRERDRAVVEHLNSPEVRGITGA